MADLYLVSGVLGKSLQALHHWIYILVTQERLYCGRFSLILSATFSQPCQMISEPSKHLLSDLYKDVWVLLERTERLNQKSRQWKVFFFNSYFFIFQLWEMLRSKEIHAFNLCLSFQVFFNEPSLRSHSSYVSLILLNKVFFKFESFETIIIKKGGQGK